jgi:hypothetical protein
MAKVGSTSKSRGKVGRSGRRAGALLVGLALAACGQPANPRGAGEASGVREAAGAAPLPPLATGTLKLRVIYDYMPDGTVGPNVGPYDPANQLDGRYGYPEPIVGGWPIRVTPIDNTPGLPFAVETLQELSPADGRYLRLPAGRYRVDQIQPAPPTTSGQPAWANTGANFTQGGTTTQFAPGTPTLAVEVLAGTDHASATVARFFSVCRGNPITNPGFTYTLPPEVYADVKAFNPVYSCQPSFEYLRGAAFERLGGPSNPLDIAFDPSGTMYVAGGGQGVWTQVGAFASPPGPSFFSALPGSARAEAVAVAPVGPADSNLYVAGGGKVFQRFVGSMDFADTGLNLDPAFSGGAVRLAVDPAGNLYLAYHSTVYRLPPGGSWAEMRAGLPSDFVWDLATDTAGNVYAAVGNDTAESGSYGVYRLAAGASSWTFLGGVNGRMGARALAVDVAGDLYAAVRAMPSLYRLPAGGGSWTRVDQGLPRRHAELAHRRPDGVGSRHPRRPGVPARWRVELAERRVPRGRGRRLPGCPHVGPAGGGRRGRRRVPHRPLRVVSLEFQGPPSSRASFPEVAVGNPRVRPGGAARPRPGLASFVSGLRLPRGQGRRPVGAVRPPGLKQAL